jgi:diguanylate cyclase (GGDEF)-like protein
LPERIGRGYHVASFEDAGCGKDSTIRVSEFALRDSLTDLASTRYFEMVGSEVVARGRNEPLAILLFDPDRFKVVNDTLGHVDGDSGDDVYFACATIAAKSIPT